MNKCVYYVTTVNVGDLSAQSLQIKSMSRAFNSVFNSKFKLYAFTSCGDDNCDDIPSKLLNAKGSKLFRTIHLFFNVIIDRGSNYSVFTRDLYLALLFVLIGKTVVWEAHQQTTKGAKRVLRFLNLFNKFKVLTISDALKFSGEIKINDDKIFSYHDGVSSDVFEDNDVISFSNKKTALYTGALHKGDDIESLEPLFGRFNDWDFLFVGGSEADIVHYKHLFSQYSNTSFLGRLPHNEINKYQKSAAVLLYPLTFSNKLWRYTSPLKLFEYMNSGKPIIGSNIGSVSEIINENNAFVFEGDKGVVEAFERFLNSSESVINDKLEINLSLVKNKYNWEKRAEFILNKIL